MPLQRATRYVLLLKSLEEATPEGHADKKPIQEALQMAIALATEINEGSIEISLLDD